MPVPTKTHAFDHVVVVLFENRSLDNVLGHLYGPEDGRTFDGVIGKDLSNPIPSWAEHGADRKLVPYTVATDMDSPNPDSGEEWYHTNTQLFNVVDDHNRFKIGEAVTEPWNAPAPGATPTMDGFVTDYISTFTGEIGRQPRYDEYAHIMTGYTPDQLPVLNGIARDFGVFHPAFGRSLTAAADLSMDNPSSMLAGEAFLERVFNAYRSAIAETGPNIWNTPLLIGWDEPGGTYDHIPPGPVPPPDPDAPAGEFGFTFDRSGYRVPAILVSPWVEPGSVYNEEYRHTSLIATLRKVWGLGEAFTQRDASARTFDHLLARDTPRDPNEWATHTALTVPEWTMDLEVVGQALSTLGKAAAPALIARARELGVPLPPELDKPGADIQPRHIIPILRQISVHFFPLLARAQDQQPYPAS
jgi:Phosphoesterase family